MNWVPIEGLTSKDYILYKLFKINGSLDFSYDVNLSLSEYRDIVEEQTHQKICIVASLFGTYVRTF